MEDARFKIVLQPGFELFLDNGDIDMDDVMNHPPQRRMIADPAYPLHITSAFLKAFHGFAPAQALDGQTVASAVQRFFAALGIVDYDHRILPLYELRDAIPVVDLHLPIEVLALRFAVREWLDNNKTPDLRGDEALYMPADKYEDKSEPFAGFIFSNRLQEAPATIESMDGGSLARCHESKSLLALAWAEIWHALDNKDKIRVRICPYCSAVFKVPVSHPKMHNCKSNECRTKHKIDSHGGPDSYRAYETENKKKREPGRKPGRPRIKEKEKRGRGRPRKFGKRPPGKG